MERSEQEGTSVPKIRHIALRATDVEAMANFFVNVFGVTIAYRRKNGSIDLSDGTMNLAILPLRLSGHQPGFDHMGSRWRTKTKRVSVWKPPGPATLAPRLIPTK